MKPSRFLTSLLIFLCVIGCHITPKRPSLHDEEIVLRVWDALDTRYGTETLFECEYLPVTNGRIEIIKPYCVSDIAVVTHSPSGTEPKFFRAVGSNPGENEFVIRGNCLLFHPSHEGQSLFVAWKREQPETSLAPKRTKPFDVENTADRLAPEVQPCTGTTKAGVPTLSSSSRLGVPCRPSAGTTLSHPLQQVVTQGPLFPVAAGFSRASRREDSSIHRHEAKPASVPATPDTEHEQPEAAK